LLLCGGLCCLWVWCDIRSVSCGGRYVLSGSFDFLGD